MTDKTLRTKIRKQWSIDVLVQELCEATWSETEHNRCDRRIWIGSYATISEMAQEVFPAGEWADAAKEGFEHEIVDDYVETLAAIVADGKCVQPDRVPSGVKEWRPPVKVKPQKVGDVYGGADDGEVYLGQYEDMSAEEMRARGHNVED